MILLFFTSETDINGNIICWLDVKTPIDEICCLAETLTVNIILICSGLKKSHAW